LRRLCTCVLVVALGGLLVAGCGASSSSTTSAPATAPSGGTSAVSPTTSLSPEAMVKSCKDNIQKIPRIPAATKAKLLGNCEKAGGDVRAQREVVHEACEAIVLQKLPAGLLRERALVVCRSGP